MEKFLLPQTEEGWKKLMGSIAFLYRLDSFVCDDLPASREGWDELCAYLQRQFPPVDEVRNV